MHTLLQDYVETAEQVYCPAPLPEGPADALLTRCWSRHRKRCRRRRPKRRPRGPERVSVVRLCQKPCPKTTRHTPPTKGRNKQKKTPHPKRMRGLGRRTRGPEKAPRWDLMGTEGCGSGKVVLWLPLMFLGYKSIYRRKK